MRDISDLLIGEKKNCRVKWYGDEVAEILVANRPVFAAGTVPHESPSVRTPVRTPGRAAPANIDRARRRARAKLFDLAYCNEWDFFGTLTLDRQKIDRYDYKAIVKKLNTWLNNRVQRKGLTYVIVPEYHKDGAIHFHGLFNNCLNLAKTGKFCQTQEGTKEIYNCTEWKFGFTSFIPITGDKARICGYLAKYITKDGEKVGGRYYLSGGNLKNPGYTYDNVDFETFESEQMFEISNTGLKFKRKF